MTSSTGARDVARSISRPCPPDGRTAPVIAGVSLTGTLATLLAAVGRMFWDAGVVMTSAQSQTVTGLRRTVCAEVAQCRHQVIQDVIEVGPILSVHNSWVGSSVLRLSTERLLHLPFRRDLALV